jgi:hypothetical protein
MCQPIRLSFLLLFLAWAVSPAIATAQRLPVAATSTPQSTPPRYKTTCFITRSIDVYQTPSKVSARIGTVQNLGGFTQLTLAEDSSGSNQWLHVVEGDVQGKRQSLSGYVLNDRVATPASTSNAVHGCIVEPSFKSPTDTAGKGSDNPSNAQSRQPLTRPKPPQVTSSPSDETEDSSVSFTCWLNRSVNVYKQPKLAAERIAKIEVGEKEVDVSIAGAIVEAAFGDPGWLHVYTVNRSVNGKDQVQRLSGYVFDDQQAVPKNQPNAIKRCEVVSPFSAGGSPQRRRRH